MKQKVYLETSVISYLTSKLSRDLIVAGHQQITQEWWEKRGNDFDMFVSELVAREAGRGDESAAERRLSAIAGIPPLELTEEALALARELVRESIVPAGAPEDALHIALATVHGMDYIVTWNCKHIANAEVQKGIARIASSLGYESPVICTPEELLGESGHVEGPDC